MAHQPAVKFITYLLTTAIVASLVVAAAWAFWVMFVAWNLSASRDWAPLVVTATSIFWLCIGGLIWLTPSRRPKS